MRARARPNPRTKCRHWNEQRATCARSWLSRLNYHLGVAHMKIGTIGAGNIGTGLGMLLAQMAYAQGMGARIGLSLLRDAASGDSP